MIATTIIYTIVGFIIAALGYVLFNASEKSEKGWRVFGAIIFVVGGLICLGAELNLYFNGTQEELIKWMFWMKD